MNKFELALQESILNPEAQKYIDDSIKKHGDSGYKEHDHIFGDKDHVVIPLGTGEHHRKVDVDKIHPSIKQTLAKHGYGIHDYVNNVAVRTRQNKMGMMQEDKPAISTILAKEKDGEALKHFNDDKQRHSRISQEHEIVISRDPQKVGRMTSSRRWCGEHCTRLPGPEMKHPEMTKHISDSEMKIGGLFHHTIEHDIKHGTLIGYMVKKGDHNAENPLGRILLKKHNAVDEKGNPMSGRAIWRPETYHDFGSSPDNFKSTMKNWAEEKYPALKGKEKALKYKKEPELYDDKAETESSDFIHRAKGLHRVGNAEFHINDSNQLHDPKEGTPAKVTHRALDFVREEHYQNGVPHRSGDEPQEKKYQFGSNGKTLMHQVWRQKGFVHRDGDKPASIERSHVDENTHTYNYMKYDLKHRDTKLGPASFSHRHTSYFMNGIEHRPAHEGPSHIERTGEYRHQEFGSLVRPPHGGPSKGNFTTGDAEWSRNETEPEIKMKGGSSIMSMVHHNGDAHTYNKETGIHTVVDENGITKKPMTLEDHNLFDDYKTRSNITPKFTALHPPA